MEEKKEIILPNKRYKGAKDDELLLQLNLETTQSLLREGDKNIIIDVAELNDIERNKSTQYKIYGKLKMIFRNMFSGTTTYPNLEETLYLNGDGTNNDFSGYLPYNEFAFLRRDLYREKRTPQTGTTLGVEYNPTITYVGSRKHTTITTITAPYHNWNLYLTYVFDKDEDYPMEYTLSGGTSYQFTSSDGIPFRVIDDGKFYTLISPVPHGINESEYIVLSGGTLDGSIETNDNTFYIDGVGNETYNSKSYVIKLYKSQFKPNQVLEGVVFGKRCLDKNNISHTISNYYVHKHKTLTNIDDYIMDNIGFESSIFEDEKKIIIENSSGDNDVIVERNRMENIIFDFKNPININGLTNNLGFSPFELYLTTIFRNGNGYFNYPPKVGYKFNFHDTWIDNYFDNETSIENGLSGETFTISGKTFVSGTTIPIGTVLNGAFVEYNKIELKERVISESFHKITCNYEIFDHQQTNSLFFSGATLTNPYGLFYQPHYRIKIRELSPYIESSDTNEVYNLPDNTYYDIVDKIWKWRDLYPHGYVDSDGNGTNFPFLNNIHYVKSNINFYLRNEVDSINKKDGINNFNNIFTGIKFC
jgi:hypothetical protein